MDLINITKKSENQSRMKPAQRMLCRNKIRIFPSEGNKREEREKEREREREKERDMVLNRYREKLSTVLEDGGSVSERVITIMFTKIT